MSCARQDRATALIIRVLHALGECRLMLAKHEQWELCAMAFVNKRAVQTLHVCGCDALQIVG
jgi:hypothetical protein